MTGRTLSPPLALLGGLLLLALAGCGASPSGSVGPAQSDAAPSASVAAPSALDEPTCDPIDIRLPSGDAVDLTGTWRGNDDGMYQVRQYGSCVWWVGQTPSWVHTLHGALAADLSLSASWATVATSDVGTPGTAAHVPAAARLGTGTILLRIEVGPAGTNADLTLVKVSGTDTSQGGIRTTEWTRVDDQPDHPLPTP